MARRSAEARKWLRTLDAELEVARRVTRKPLQWGAHEQQIIGQICDQIDRKVQLLALYAKVEDSDQAVKLSSEARLLEQSIARLMKAVTTDVPAPRSLRSQKAAAAANTRWRRDDEREKGAG